MDPSVQVYTDLVPVDLTPTTVRHLSQKKVGRRTTKIQKESKEEEPNILELYPDHCVCVCVVLCCACGCGCVGVHTLVYSGVHTSPVHSSVHTPPVHSSVHTPPVHSSVHTPPVHSSVHTPPVHSSLHTPPVHSDVHTSPVHFSIHVACCFLNQLLLAFPVTM